MKRKYKPGKKSNIEEERNQALISDYTDHSIVNGRIVWKIPMLDLDNKYSITNARIYAILKKYNIPTRSVFESNFYTQK